MRKAEGRKEWEARRGEDEYEYEAEDGEGKNQKTLK